MDIFWGLILDPGQHLVRTTQVCGWRSQAVGSSEKPLETNNTMPPKEGCLENVQPAILGSSREQLWPHPAQKATLLTLEIW